MVGSKEKNGELIRLWKWNICIQQGPNMPWESYEVQNFLCARLRGLIASQGTHKFIAYSDEPEASKTALLVRYEKPKIDRPNVADVDQLWVFIPDLIYSSSLEQSNYKHAMKILYRKTSHPDSRNGKGCPTTEELQLSGSILQCLHDDLVASSRLLPPSARKFQDWEVGLLAR